MSAALRASRAESIVRSLAQALDPYVALWSEQPEEGFVCGFCGEDRGDPHAEQCAWFAATLFVKCYPESDSRALSHTATKET